MTVDTQQKKKLETYSFCESFIDRLVEYVDEHYIKTGADLSRLAICFGGKRPALFIKRELAKRIGKSFYSPRFFTIDEFMSYVAYKDHPFGSTQDLDSCFLLYKLAEEVAPEILKGRESFAQFLPWTREILKFIDQLDLEHIDSKRLKNIQSNAQIGYPVPDDINQLLQHVVRLREAYHKSLKEQKTYSRGLQYLMAAESIKHVNFDEFDQILFCNFFYFNSSEEIVVKELYNQNKATLFFQGDQRKWPVLDRIAKVLDHTIEEGEAPEETDFKLKLYKGFDVHSQVGLVREILKTVKDTSNAVIVLPNPDHIIPLVSEVAQLVGDFNISMGYPLKRSTLYSLFEFIFKAQLSSKADQYYAKDYLKAIRHPFIKSLKIDQESSVTRTLIHVIEEVLTGKERTELSGSLFFNLSDVETLDEIYALTLERLEQIGVQADRRDLELILSTVHQSLFTQWEDINTFEDFASSLDLFLQMLIQKSSMKNYPLNVNIANKMHFIKDEFKNASFKSETFEKEDMFRIFDSKISREIVAFVGSPLKGLQILGLFETRSLNFEDVIVLDVNEGTLPSLSIHEPLIPREVMISLGLDRLELEEEIQRYQFMRLISSAKNVHLVYQESKDKEKSRFIEELIWEEQKKNNSLEVIATQQANFQVKVGSKRVFVEKTPKMIEYLKTHTFSASSINMYLRNPLDFYYNYVLGLREQEDLLDEPEARHIGTFIHELLEDSFKPFLNKKPEINATFRNRFAKLFNQKFEEVFGRSMRSDSFLLRSILLERLSRFLDNEQNGAQRKVEEILYLENRFQETIDLSVGPVKFGYIVDRVDRMQGGEIMIVDYKTGAVDQMPKAIDRIDSMELSRQTIFDEVRSFQIPLYFHYLDQQFKDQDINAALYNLRTLELHKFIDHRMSYSREQINQAFLRALDFVLSEILDPNIPFEEDLSSIKY